MFTRGPIVPHPQTHPESPQAPPAAAGEMLRLFIALDMPAAILDHVAALSEKLQKGARFTVCHPSWADPRTIHLTLIFLGKMPAERVPDIAQSMETAALGIGPQRLEIKRLGVFPHWRRPSVLWAGIRDRTHQLGALHQALEKQLQPLGYRPESREFHPHLTLARFKSIKGVAMMEEVVKHHQGFVFGPFETAGLTLFKSDLNPQGAIHTPLRQVALQGERGVETADAS
jgi:2'-5' RNA ligase